VHRCVPSQVAPVSTRQVSLHSGLLPSMFRCTRQVCKVAVRPDVAASISSNITFAECFDRRCIGASQVKLLPFQHGNSVFIPDCCHRCSDTWGTSSSSPYVRTLSLGSAATSPLRRFFDHLCIRASQVESLLLQHCNSVFNLDCCHRCLDAWDVRVRSAFSRTVRSDQPPIGHLIEVSAFSNFCQDQLQLLQPTPISFRSPVQS